MLIKIGTYLNHLTIIQFDEIKICVRVHFGNYRHVYFTETLINSCESNNKLHQLSYQRI